MSTIRLTSKRQATLPKALCEQMQLRPGDCLEIEQADVNGEPVWIMKRAVQDRPPWFGALRVYAAGKSHDLQAIRQSVESEREFPRT